MSWLGPSRSLALDRGASGWTLVAAEPVAKDRAPRLLASLTLPASPDESDVSDRAQQIREFRTRERLPARASAVLWPEPQDAGVVALDARDRGLVVLPKARVIRDRVAPLVRGGAKIREILLPHEAATRLVRLAGWSGACVLLMEPTAACVTVIESSTVEATYLQWTPEAPAATESARLLARYQFAARLAPHLRVFARQGAAMRLVVCGRFPDLRSAMVPIVEELDREVDVLDAGLVGESSSTEAEPDETCGRQLAWAVAACGT